jgi:hypothetical protein
MDAMKRIAEHLTREDLAEVESIAGDLEVAISKHRAEDVVPVDVVRFAVYRLRRLYGIQRSIPLREPSPEPVEV